MSKLPKISSHLQLQKIKVYIEKKLTAAKKDDSARSKVEAALLDKILRRIKRIERDG